ncbi:hypothetical protein G7Y89_g15524 [Cudoniella acicularis]|uniref:Uncharacterized protein n=1 Tax=Cudoniella acicularis TaxID=354080 RepID=A0A8H4QKZ8_9HELO|nr:hypothetical protein G7Y89_g15524 [Cudoniella acicularis]
MARRAFFEHNEWEINMEYYDTFYADFEDRGDTEQIRTNTMETLLEARLGQEMIMRMRFIRLSVTVKSGTFITENFDPPEKELDSALVAFVDAVKGSRLKSIVVYFDYHDGDARSESTERQEL